MPTAKTENYTSAQTADMVERYQNAGTDTTTEGHSARDAVVQALAVELKKSPRSIRSKLVTQKVYIKKAEKSKVTGESAEKK